MSDAPPAWLFEVDPDDVDLGGAFDDGDAVLDIEITDHALVEVLAPGQVAHLLVRSATGAVPSAVYASGSVIGPVTWVEDDDDRFPVASLGLDPLASPVPLDALSAAPTDATPLGLGSADADRLAGLPIGELARVLRDHEPGEHDDADEGDDDGIVLPALEVRLPADTLLVVPGDGDWIVVHGDAELRRMEELPERHATLLDAVEYVAAVADKAARELPVVDLDDLEAVAVLDAGDGVWAIAKTGPRSFSVCSVPDEGEIEVVDELDSLREAILAPLLDDPD